VGSIRSPAQLRANLGLVREAGYAVDDEEQAVGLRCVSAPIFNENGDVIAAISVSGPLARIDDSRLVELQKLVRLTADVISSGLGGGRS
jgi:IclR family transcriptional regulator, acetate operon repressor